MSGYAGRVVAIALFSSCAWFSPQAAAACEPLAILFSLQVQGQPVDAAAADRFVVERPDEDAVTVFNGMPLCPNDRLATRTDTKAILKIGFSDGAQHEVTMRPGSTVILETVNRVQLLVGRLFAALQGEFDVVMPLGRLAATGTEYELAVTDAGCTVDQLEGTTELTSGTGGSVHLARLKGAACTTAAAPTVTDLTVEQCFRLMEVQSQINIQGRPKVSSINKIKQFDPAQAPAIYSSARQKAVCAEDAGARNTLNQVLVDWRESQKALRGLRSSAAPDALAVGEALVMRGQPAEALQEFSRAIAAGDATAAPLTGSGDAERDLGLIALKAGNTASFASHLESASHDYLLAMERAQKPIDRGVILVNLGDLALLRTRLDASAAEVRLAEAQEFYDRARAQGDPPHARLGIARISLMRAQLIPTQVANDPELSLGQQILVNSLLAMLAEQQRRPHREAARQVLRDLIGSTPGFSPAEELLGETIYLLGDIRDARRHLRSAISADPAQTSAYQAYAKTVNGAERRLYERTYKLVEVKPVRDLTETRSEILIPAAATVTIPPAPLTADVTRLNFVAPPWNDQVVVLTNRSDASATAEAIRITGSDPGAFQITSDGCSGTALAAQKICRLVVSLVSRQMGTYRATLEISGNGGQWTREVRLRADVRGGD
jgi:tetratricopeptide (TPR) repeat protein